MILTPIPLDALPALLDRFDRALGAHPAARTVFQRIAASTAHLPGDLVRWHRDAVSLAARLGMAPLDEAPQRAFSWDGTHVRTQSEPAVLVHEIAHFQLAPPERRFAIDFGLGAGPETGRIAEADAAIRAGEAAREREERLASLLGVLWDVELGQPGIEAFQEQNWLEGAGRAGAAEFFAGVVADLKAGQLIDADGRPREVLNIRSQSPSPPRRAERALCSSGVT